MAKKFPTEFRNDVITATQKGDTPLAQIAKDFGISDSCLRKWVNDAKTSPDSKQNTDAKELAGLKKRNRILEQENEILRRAAAFFAKEISPK